MAFDGWPMDLIQENLGNDKSIMAFVVAKTGGELWAR
jgi:hypothetical protein